MILADNSSTEASL